MFEPNRLAQQCLQDAYACLMPTVRRRLRQTQPTVQPEQKGKLNEANTSGLVCSCLLRPTE